MRKIASKTELFVELNTILNYCQTSLPSRARLASALQRLSERMTKQAMLNDGPVGLVLNQHWNKLHDIEYDLKQSIRDYADAAHCMDGPAEHDAKEMIKKIEAVAKLIDNLAKEDFNNLADAEAKFIKKHGDPATYSDKQRREIFPR